MHTQKKVLDGKQSREAKQCCCEKHCLEATWIEKGSIPDYSLQYTKGSQGKNTSRHHGGLG